jgi:hypothetical protein
MLVVLIVAALPWIVLGVALAEAANATHVGLTLSEVGEAAILRPARSAIMRAPRIVLGVGRRTVADAMVSIPNAMQMISCQSSLSAVMTCDCYRPELG